MYLVIAALHLTKLIRKAYKHGKAYKHKRTNLAEWVIVFVYLNLCGVQYCNDVWDTSCLTSVT
jgi:hypothetical protein